MDQILRVFTNLNIKSSPPSKIAKYFDCGLSFNSIKENDMNNKLQSLRHLQTYLSMFYLGVLLSITPATSQARDLYWNCDEGQDWDQLCWSTSSDAFFTSIWTPTVEDRVFFNTDHVFDSAIVNVNTLTINSDVFFNAYSIRAQSLKIGSGGTGVMTNATDSVNVGNLSLGVNSTDAGRFINLSDLTAVNEYIGLSGAGEFQAGSNSNTTENLFLGYYSSGFGNYLQRQYGDLSAQNEYIGFSGTGQFTQGSNTIPGIRENGGTHNVSESLILGYNSTGNGQYELVSGELTVQNETIGLNGEGRFSQSGGTHLVNGNITLGGNATGFGAYVLNNSSLTVGNRIYIGNYGAGTVNIQNGGLVSNVRGYIGTYAGSNGTVSVDGVGSSWSNSENLYVGNLGSGELDITNGGSVSSATSYIGNYDTGIGTVTVDGVGSSWTNSGGLYVGNNGAGNLTVQNNGAVDVGGTTIIGDEVTLTGGNITTGGWSRQAASLFNHTGGTLTIDGGRSLTGGSGQFDSGSSHYVLSGINTPTIHLVNGAISNGTNVSINEGKLITDSGSAYNLTGYLRVGDTFGSAELNILNGATINSDLGYIGTFAGVSGEATVAGANSNWTSRNLYLGNLGTGNLNITGGGTVSTSNAYLGNYIGANGTATVTGEGSTWSNNDNLYVGDDATGHLNIYNAGTVTSTRGYLGTFNGSTGTVTIDGGNSSWTNSDNLYVGNFGSGNLNILNGGSVSNVDGFVGNYAGSDGTVVVDGEYSSWHNSNNLYIGRVNNSGRLSVRNNAIVTATNSIVISENGTAHLDGGVINATIVDNNGQLNGSGLINSNLTNSGVLAPGQSPGLLEINGDFTQTLDGVLNMEIGGLFAGTEYDVVNVSGTATLGGTLDVDWFDLGDGLFGGSLGDSFDIISADSFAGEFDLLTLAILNDGLDWNLEYLIDEVGSTDILRLSVVSAVPVPATVWLFGSGLIGLVGFARRRTK